MKKTEEPIIVEQTFDASVETVWNAITKLDQMRQWYFENIPAFKPEVGFETQFDVETGERIFPHQWKITEAIPLKSIAYNWKYENYPGDSFVTFEISAENGYTKLKLTHRVTEDFPEDIPEFSRESGIEGWKYFICKRLKEFLENNC